MNKAFSITAPFYRFFITNTAQAGLAASLLINSQFMSQMGVIPISNTISGLPGTLQQVGITPTITDVSMAAGDTEYNYVLPTGTKFFTMHVKDDSAAYRVAYTAGKVAGSTEPYINVLVAGYYSETALLTPANLTLYFASSTAGLKMEVTSWV
jgi:hypothetical protein